jgi:uncharacterized protein
VTLRRDDGRIVCESVEVADRWGLRLRGLLGRRGLASGTGLLLRPSFSIHTAFMRFPIDAVFLDHDLVVLRVEQTMRPFRTASCRGAREVVELAAGECARRGLAVGDRVAWASHADVMFASAEQGAPRTATTLGRVLVASRDARFIKLIGFLLDQQGIEPVAVTPDHLQSATESEEELGAVILDAQDAVADALANANSARALRPELPLVLAGETRAAERAPVGTRIYDKWNETDELIAAVSSHLTALSDDRPAPSADR